MQWISLQLLFSLFFHSSFGCFTIVHLNNNPCSSIKVILANNRDENISRPTDDASYWPNDLSYIYGGRDVKRNSSDSTWLSMNTRTGRIANLLFLAGNRTSDKRKNGPLITNYLFSNYSSTNTSTYVNELYTNRQDYRDDNWLLLDYLENDYWKLYYTNNNEMNEFNQILHALVSGTFVVSNNLYARPFQKVLFGQKIFADILERYKHILNDEEIYKDEINGLINAIMYEILQNRTFLYTDGHDQNLKERFLSADTALKLNELSAISANYTTVWENAQTRTNTIIIVLQNGTVLYIERTLKHDQYNNLYWSFTNNSFQIKSIYDRRFDEKCVQRKKSNSWPERIALIVGWCLLALSVLYYVALEQ